MNNTSSYGRTTLRHLNLGAFKFTGLLYCWIKTKISEKLSSALDSIPGIGEKRKAALLKTFKSVARIKKATLEEIAAVVGEAAAKNIKESLTE